MLRRTPFPAAPRTDPAELSTLTPPSVSQTPAPAVMAPAFQPIERRVPIVKTRRNLPHWEQAGCTYFITYRLADALPAAKCREWRWQLGLWIEHHPRPWSEADWMEYHNRFEGPLQQWLDAGHGSCALKNPALREIVVESFHHHDGVRYHMRDYVIMPNHVHLLVTPYHGHLMREIVNQWKRFTAHQILKRIRATPPFWLEESYDHIVRSERQLRFYQRYIRENPEKASLPSSMWTHWAREMGGG
jgi:REP element-mobilizing transposase RayT